MRIIAGNCQHEGLQHSIDIMGKCKEICDKLGIEYIGKASFDKANRTSDSGKRGLGFEKTMEDFIEIKKQLNIPLLTDFHTEQQITDMMFDYPDAVDVVQIPAFLCRQTDLIKQACASGKIVNIKKGQFISHQEVNGIMSKTNNAKEVWITERGNSFGYNRLVVDYTGVQYLIDTFSSNNVIMDCTHAVAFPGGNGTSSGGNREYVPTIALAAAGIGVTNFFLETHPNPESAPSDGPNMVRLSEMEELIFRIKTVSDATRNWSWLKGSK